MYVYFEGKNMTPSHETGNCKTFLDSLGALFLLASSILPGNEEAASEVLMTAYHRWKQRPEAEWTLLNAQRDVVVEALERASSHPQELLPSETTSKEMPAETSTVLALPILERIVFLMGAVCRFGVEEISKLLRIPSKEVQEARINAFRHLPEVASGAPMLQALTA